ncbi:MAG: myo-inositol-1(or 4)-monophosphatase [Saprospiraceae bacterium]|jgi:myo-inositol-1(or 4)-monophosphatase
MDPMLNIGIKAVRLASKVILQSIDRVDQLDIQSKGRNDFVTQVDKKAEELIIETILAAYPDHQILAEESGKSGQSERRSQYQWIIDPLDGTTNYLHQYPVFTISLAIMEKGQLIGAIVYDPTRDEMFTAIRGKGAQLNDRRIRASQTPNFASALIGTGMPDKDMKYLAPWTKSFQMLAPHVNGIRRSGSAALDLAYVACGRFDGFWEYGLSTWDLAAGVLLIQEAGGLVSDTEGKQNMLETGHIIAGNTKLFSKLQVIVKEHAKGIS